MKKKISILALLLILVLTGCKEQDGNSSTDGEIKEEIQLSEVTYPNKVAIYETKYWQADEKQIVDIMMPASIDIQKDKNADGDVSYTSAVGEEKVLVIPQEGGGFNYDNMCKLPQNQGLNVGAWEIPSEIEDLEYRTTGHLRNNAPEESYSTSKKKVQQCMAELQFPQYECTDAAIVLSEKSDYTLCLMYWRQMVDDVPFSSIYISDFGSLQGTKVYDPGWDQKIKQIGNYQDGGIIQIMTVDDEIISWFGHGAVVPTKKLGTYKVVSVEEAYKNVKRIYSGGSAVGAILKDAQLQYKSVEVDGVKQLFPVWMFAIAEEEPLMAEWPVKGQEGYTWHYYLINAITGDFLTDVNVR